jgi:hypothetical protein
LLARAFGVPASLALSSLIFGIAHYHNPHASLLSAISIAVEAGLLFAGFYLLTGRIWISIGAHAGWNFAQGGIFGARVSGFDSDGSLLRSVPLSNAPTWLTGGDFGPEASLIAVIIGLAAFLVTMRLVGRSASRAA